MRRFFRRMALSLLFLLVPAAEGEVFLLWPWKGSGDADPQIRMAGIPGISSAPLYSEKLTVNGVQLELEAFAVNLGFAELEGWLKARLRPENLSRVGDTIRVTFRLPDHFLERWLLIDSGPDKPVSAFRIAAPEKLPAASDWPPELPPLPAGATPVQVIHLEGRDGWYGAFSGGSAEPEQGLRTVSDRLRNEGWTAVGNEARPSIGGTGDLFLRARPRTLLWVSFTRDGGAFYARPY